MNLSMDCLRWITTRALRGHTFAADRVYDSPATPADLRFEEQRAPFIGVYVDSLDLQTDYGSMMEEQCEADLVIEVGVAAQYKFNANDEPVSWETPDPAYIITHLNETDEGLEAQIGFIMRQVTQTLLSTSTANPWAELWRTLTGCRIKRVAIRRGGPVDTANQGAPPRYASRIMTMRVQLLGEPVRGEKLEDFEFWNRFVLMAEADPYLSGLGELVRAHIEHADGVPLEMWRIHQKITGVDTRAARATGEAPVHPVDEAAAPLAKATPVGEPYPPETWE